MYSLELAKKKEYYSEIICMDVERTFNLADNLSTNDCQIMKIALKDLLEYICVVKFPSFGYWQGFNHFVASFILLGISETQTKEILEKTIKKGYFDHVHIENEQWVDIVAFVLSGIITIKIPS